MPVIAIENTKSPFPLRFGLKKAGSLAPYCLNDVGWSAATMRIAYSGIKFFYTKTIPQDWETLQLLKKYQSLNLFVIDYSDKVKKSEMMWNE